MQPEPRRRVPITGAHHRARVENQRVCEVYRYFEPPPLSKESNETHQATSPDPSLTAFSQLCALRIGTRLAMISVIDGENQYMLAESTKSLDLDSAAQRNFEDDGLWYGCGTVARKGRLCEWTIALPPATVDHVPLFTVTDLSQHSEFRHLPFVSQYPHFKFYSGTPLTTRNGYNIGSLFVMDQEVRPPLNDHQRSVIGSIARVIVNHLEMVMEVVKRKKIMRLSDGMNSFVQGRSKFVLAESTQSENKAEKKLHRESVVLARSDDSNDDSNDDSEDVLEDSETRRRRLRPDAGPRATLERAANILCDSLNVREEGGVIFYDATSRVEQTAFPSTNEQDASIEHEAMGIADILACSDPSVCLESSDIKPEAVSYQAFDQSFLHGLLRKHPRGKTWSFNDEGTLSSSDDELSFDTLRAQIKASPTSEQHREGYALQKIFPGVRHLVFIGLWDAGSSRWFAGGFAWTASLKQIFAQDTELSHFRAFGNSVMSEVSRLESIASDRKKADFIGSISHEFRSPLHGILASAEFLMDSQLDNFQTNLVDTVSSCGRTLLDTINHVLDYSKINTFERNFHKSRRSGMKSRKISRIQTVRKDAPPMMSIYATIDVAAITEEVVEGVYTGQMYQDIGSTDATDFSLSARAEAAKKGIGKNSQHKLKTAKNIKVIIDIAHDDFTFTTQPGAFKRIIMNIFGNALKYTAEGQIVVRLRLEKENGQEQDASIGTMVDIRVIDTGKGISAEYLRTSLFKPFCQEDPLSPGTGLGLSIVRSIVTVLSGTIDVRRRAVRGTEVVIRLPMTQSRLTATPSSTPLTGTSDELVSNSISILRSEFQNVKVALFGFDKTNDSASDMHIFRVLQEYVEGWYGFKLIESTDFTSADLVIIDEFSLPHLPQDHQLTVPTVVLGSNATRSLAASRHGNERHFIPTLVTKPIGPYKLAKAVHVCLSAREKILEHDPTLVLVVSELDSQTDKDTIVPDLERFSLDASKASSSPRLDDQESLKHDNPIALNTHVRTVMPGPHPAVRSSSFYGKDFELLRDQKMVIDERSPEHFNSVSICDRRPKLLSTISEPNIRFPQSQRSGVLSGGKDVLAPPFQPLPNERAAPLTKANVTLHNEGVVTQAPSKAVQVEQEGHAPRLLLVDDNNINLRLLQTYMRKRRYTHVDSAENGLLALEAAEACVDGYDIIFMDVSMPVMNGFEATRAIRDLEDERCRASQEDEAKDKDKPFKRALIIALTGLASSEDHAEAFISGVDLFMTKPVSFKEVGRLLDNWEEHGAAVREKAKAKVEMLEESLEKME